MLFLILINNLKKFKLITNKYLYYKKKYKIKIVITNFYLKF